MSRTTEGSRSLARRVRDGRFAVGIVACVAGGVVLSVMVLGSGPLAPVSAFPAPAASVSEATAEEVATPQMPIDDTVSSVPDVAIGGSDAVDGSSITPDSAVQPPVTTDSTSMPVVQPPVVSAAPPAARPITVAVVPPTTAKSVATSPASTTAAPTTSAPATGPAAAQVAAPTAPKSTPATTPVTAAAATLTYPSSTVAGVAQVDLVFDGSTIRLASVAAQPNWVYATEVNGPRSVEIKFFNTVTQREAELHAEIEGGRIKFESSSEG